MRGVLGLAGGVCLAVAMTGCGARGSGGVAIVDLEQVAKRLGRQEVMNKELQQRQQQITAELAKLEQQAQQQLEQAAAQLGPEPTPEQQQQLQQLRTQLLQKINQARLQAQNMLQQARVELVGTFREEVRPVAQKVATERGLSIVLVRDQQVLSYEPAADITDQVVDRLPLSPAAEKAPEKAPADTEAAPEKSAADGSSPQ